MCVFSGGGVDLGVRKVGVLHTLKMNLDEADI